MAFLEADILARLDDTLNDSARTRWSTTERQRWILDAQQKVCDVVPGAGLVIETTLTLEEGIVQDVSAAIEGKTIGRVMDVICNVSAVGVRGKAVRKIAKDQLDAQRPGWPSQAASNTVTYWMPLEHEPLRFYVYPAATGVGNEARLRALLATVPVTTGVIEVRDSFKLAVLFWVSAMCNYKDNTPASPVRAREFLELWAQEMMSAPGADKKALAMILKRHEPR